MKTRLNKIISTILVAVMLVTAAPLSGFVGLDLNLDWLNFTTRASAEELSGTCGDNLTWTLDTETGELIISGTGAMKDYFDFNAPWYNYCSSIKTLTIEGGVTTIGYEAFSYHSSLTNVTIGNSVTTIGAYAFVNCDSLTSITIPDSVTTIGDEAFFDCNSLTSVTIGDSVTTIGISAFSSCTSLTSVTIGDSVTTIGNYAFYDCDSLTSVDIGNSVTSIGSSAFYNCTGLTSVTIPDSVTSIGDSAFGACLSLTSITIPDSVTTIGDSAFSDCYNLTSAIIGNSVSSIGVYVFSGCNSVAFYINKGSYAESYANDNSIAYHYQYDESEEKIISVSVTSKLSFEINKETLTLNINCTGNMLSFGSEDAPWVQYKHYYKNVIINDGCTSISVNAFNSIKEIKSFSIPDSVTTIGSSAFSGCTGLASVTIPDSVTSIGSSAFSGCTGLTSVTIGNSVTSIGSSAFSYCTGITSVTIPDSVTSIGNSAFQGCNSLEEITLPFVGDSATATLSSGVFGYIFGYTSSNVIGTTQQYYSSSSSSYSYFYNYYYIPRTLRRVTITKDETIPCGAFYNCSFLTEISILGVKSIGERAFYNCTGLTSVTIPDSVTTIGSSAFDDCIGLTSVIIPDSVTSIGSDAFSGCTGFTSVTIGNSVISIGSYAFHYCTELENVYYTGDLAGWCGITFSNVYSNPMYYTDNLYINGELAKDIVIPDSVTSIGERAFYNCTGLTSVTIGDSVTTIGSSAFYNCSNLGSVTLPISVNSIGYYAFNGCQSLEKLKVYNRSCTFGIDATSYYTTICGYAGSTAETYANNTGFDFELISDDDHEHIYSNGCDNECNICGYIRTDLTHTYSSVCDVDCDLCGFIRTDVVHTYSNGCDSDCDVCGYIRTEFTHTYDNDCDPECNYCDFVRTPKHKDENNDGICDVCEKALSDILVGVEQNFKVKAGETVYIKFIPANSGIYTFYSSSSTDTYGYVFDVNKNQLSSNDDGGNGNNFSITYTFKAGTVYYLGVRYYSSSNSGEIPVTIRLDEFICDHNNTHSEHKDSSCSEYGYDKVICDDCGATVSETELPLLDHSYKAIVSNPTCQSAGSVVQYCMVCKYAYLEKITDLVGHDMHWVMVTKPTSSADGVKNYSCSYCGLVEDTKVVPAFLISDNSVANIDFDSNTISGFDAGATSIDDYVSVETDGYSFTCDSAVIGTGTVIELTDGDTVITEFTAVVFGDVNGDGWYDGTDSIIVSCLANGLLSRDDVSPAFYQAADCNHDGVIDSFDVAILEQAGLLLSNVDQSKSNEELVTDAAFIEYLDLIDQTPEDETVEDEIIETPEVEPETEEFDFIEFIITIIKKFFELLLSTLPIK